MIIWKNRKKWCLITMLGIFAAAAIIITCSKDKPTEELPSNIITPAGGTITDPGGASITVPEGAVTEDVEISITTYLNSDALPFESGAIPRFIGGADFGPDGFEFELPVTITIPSNIALNPGDEIPLFVFNDDDSTWLSSGFVGVANADGGSFSVEITHFCLFGSFGGGVFDNFYNNFNNGQNADGALAALQSWFHGSVAYVGKKGTYENECQEVTGIFFDLGYEVRMLPDGPIYQGTPAIHEGETSDHQVSFTEVYDFTTPEMDFYYSLSIDVFIRCCAPDLEATAEPNNIDIDETSTITATLTCGEDAMSGASVTFEAAGGLGTLSETEVTTSSSGQAQTVFTAEEEGRESIITTHTACDGQETAQAGPIIDIGADWSGTCSMTFDHSGDDIPYVYSDVVSINFSFSVDEGAITGTGTGTHSINVTPTFEECSVQSIVAPAFEVEIEGTEDGDYFNFQIIPTSMPLTFTLHCVWDPDNPIDIPVPVYSNIEASIMGQDMFMEVLSENGASDSDSGSEGFGDDQPVDWSFSVTINSD